MGELGSSQGTRSGNQIDLFTSRRVKKSPGWKATPETIHGFNATSQALWLLAVQLAAQTPPQPPGLEEDNDGHGATG